MSVAITAGVGTPIAADLDAAGANQQRIVQGGQLTPVLSSIAINCAANGDNPIVALVLAQKVRLYKFFFTVNAAVNVKWVDGAAGTQFHPALQFLGQGAAWMLPFDTEPWFVTTAGNALVLNLSAAVQVSGRAYYIQAA